MLTFFSSLVGGTGFKVAIVVAILALGGAVYWQYTNVVHERNAALEQVGSLKTANAVQTATIKAQEGALISWKKQAAAFQKSLDHMAVVQAEANSTARKLNDVLSRHDLFALSLAKPVLIEHRINAGTADAIRMLNDASAGRQRNANRGGTTPK